MAYVTVDYLKASLANAGGAGARTAASLPNDRLQAAIDEAAGEVVGRLSRFTLTDPGADPAVIPPDVPPMLQTIIVGIAGYLATLEFYGTQEVQDRDPVVLRYARARELLAGLANGTLTVPGVTLGEGRTSPTGDAEVYGGASVGLASGWAADMGDGRHNTPAHYGGTVWE